MNEPLPIIADEKMWRKILSRLDDDSLIKLYQYAKNLLHEQGQDDKEDESYNQ